MNQDISKELVTLRQRTGESSSIAVEIKKIDKKSRLKNALKILSIYWLLSMLSIFLPLVHFLLVPGLFFLGIFLSYKKYEKNILLLSTSFACLSCKKVIFSKERLESLPLSIEITCPSCLVVNFLNSNTDGRERK